MNSAIPKHVAIVMDGNGRWAKKRFLPRISGHQAGVEAIRKIVKAASERGIEVLSLFAFSTENWSRPQEEVSGLMKLLLNALQHEVKKLHENNIRLRMIGERQQFSEQIQRAIVEAEVLTAKNTGMQLVIAANYGGRWDIVQAARRLAERVKAGALASESISSEILAHELQTQGLPDPDLFIRTSGELRVSNFYLWQFAYTEFYFSSVLWPDFDDAAFCEALSAYTGRERRYGRASVAE